MIFCAPTVALALPVRAKDLRTNDHLNTVSLYDLRRCEPGGSRDTLGRGSARRPGPFTTARARTLCRTRISTASGTLLTRYVSGPGMVNGAVVDELLARTSSGGTTAWYLTDKLDSVRDVVSSVGIRARSRRL